MKTSLWATIIAALPVTGSAVPVTWELQGHIDYVNLAGTLLDRMPDWADVATGEEFRVLLGFDTDAALLRTRSGGQYAPGVRYEYDPSSLSFLIQIGARTPIELGYSVLAGLGRQLIYARDNAGDLADDGEGAQVDGYTIGVASDDNLLTAGVLMRGAILDIVNGPVLPATPDPRLANLAMSVLNVAAWDDSGGFLSGVMTSVRAAPTPVPEPSTLMLGVIGLVALALDRRLRLARGGRNTGKIAL